MSMQIKSIYLYHRDGRIRTLNFKLGEVNVITGKSSAGKSAITEIIEYCLGRSEFRVPSGRIRDSVACYAVKYQIGKSEVFIAKFPPGPGESQHSEAYFQIASHIEPPPLRNLGANSTDDAIVEHLSGLLGIGVNTNIPGKDQMRLPLEATLKHARFYLFQKQGTIANQDLLFHRQGDPFIPQAIKDTLPYFLGAVREDYVKLNQELRNARRDLKIAERRLEEAERIFAEGRTVGVGLIAEAQEAGLLTDKATPTDQREALGLLQRCLSWKPTDIVRANDSRLPGLETKLAEARKNFEEIHNKISGVEIFLKEGSAYSQEVREQERRLISIDIFGTPDNSTEACPLCSSTSTNNSKALISVKKQLDRVRRDLKAVVGEQPRLQKFVAKLYAEREKIREQIQALEADVSSTIAGRSQSKSIVERNSKVAVILGKITLYLESASQAHELSPLRAEVLAKQRIVRQYENKLDPEKTLESLGAILSELSQKMTAWASVLDLEHKGHPYRLDLNKLTVVADKHGQPIPMGATMGGGENWLGCHLIAHLALHSYFAREKRPVPNFLILDQPTQVYFPPDKFDKVDGKTSKIKDEDRIAVQRMFSLLFKVCKDLAPNLQIIVLDHANIETPEFQKALVEEPWRGKNALIPWDW